MDGLRQLKPKPRRLGISSLRNSRHQYRELDVVVDPNRGMRTKWTQRVDTRDTHKVPESIDFTELTPGCRV